ncbi:MAG: pyruvate, water dikinase regulatory protein [Alphaproteobacteria bacterium]
MQKRKHHIYLISDATGETVRSIARACAVQFEDVEVVEHVWPMVRSKRALQTVFEELEAAPGLILYTMLDKELREALKNFCRQKNLTAISVIEPFINAMATYFGAASRDQPGRQHAMDAEYFTRIDAINYVMAHDDGQAVDTLKLADVILVGVSRTSKTPTCIYLANRGIKAANVPIVPNSPLPPQLFEARDALIVGLTEDPMRLVQIRRNRLRLLNQGQETDYTDMEAIKDEIAFARRLFTKHGWPVIDVTRRSIEETAAAILQIYSQRNHPHGVSSSETDGGVPPTVPA